MSADGSSIFGSKRARELAERISGILQTAGLRVADAPAPGAELLAHVPTDPAHAWVTIARSGRVQMAGVLFVASAALTALRLRSAPSVPPAYKPIDAATAKWLAREYEEAVRDRWAPPVTIRTEQLEHGDGFVLAIHVSPFPSPIAVRVRGDAGDGFGDDAWVFFSRIASQNKPFRPEMLPMLTPEARRIAIVLHSIPGDAVVHAVARTKHEGGRLDMPDSRLVTVNEMANTVVLRLPNGAERRIPLDCIRTVFQGDSGRWHVEIEHYFQIY